MRSPCTTTKSSPHSTQLEKARVQQRKPNAAKNKFIKKKKKPEYESGKPQLSCHHKVKPLSENVANLGEADLDSGERASHVFGDVI